MSTVSAGPDSVGKLPGPPAKPASLADFRQAFEELRPRAADYVDGAAGDEHTAAWNTSRYSDYQLLPRIGVDVANLDTRVEILGSVVDSPIFLAPTAGHRLCHPDGEVATAEGAAAARALWVVSIMSLHPVAEIIPLAGAPTWFQLYAQRDLDRTAEIAAAALWAGAKAVVLTMDAPARSVSDRQRRSGLSVPTTWRPPNIPRPCLDNFDPTDVYSPYVSPSVTWDTVRELAAAIDGPMLVKGVIRADDARRAVDAGAAGIIVSNHGGRHLDTTVASIDALAPVVAAVNGQVPVLVDGGVRRGVDVAKALMLGATAVGIGRPYLWGLATAGADGVRAVLDLLRHELRVAMALVGAPTVRDLTAELLRLPAGECRHGTAY
ncbi:alpha-hydroxy acid oxidase [Fodinicola acaciae]|uniref:alpha-hydroxy acid oxidase n=1 Tax=Fodinicola acaciae TaxID=2681555 RepID=UPI0013D115FF|nr:alpha-hydroxy acid oxidase [Fodinicola acaciae]